MPEWTVQTNRYVPRLRNRRVQLPFDLTEQPRGLLPGARAKTTSWMLLPRHVKVTLLEAVEEEPGLKKLSLMEICLAAA